MLSHTTVVVGQSDGVRTDGGAKESGSGEVVTYDPHLTVSVDV